MTTRPTPVFRVNHGSEEFIVIGDDRVTPDSTCGQYEYGWWVIRKDSVPPGKPDEYFLSDEGVLYTTEDGRNFDMACGYEESKRPPGFSLGV